MAGSSSSGSVRRTRQVHPPHSRASCGLVGGWQVFELAACGTPAAKRVRKASYSSLPSHFSSLTETTIELAVLA